MRTRKPGIERIACPDREAILVAVIADTHLPRGQRRLPDRCLDQIARCDALVHAGDFTAVNVLSELRAIGPPLHAIHGNVDEPALRRALPADLTLDLCGRQVVVVHDAGPAALRIERLRARHPGADAVIFAHSHMPVHETASGFQIFNPGSPTERRRAPGHSMGLMRVSEHALEFQHVALP